MKTASLLIMCFLCLALFATAGVSQAQSRQPVQPESAQAASLNFTHDFIHFSQQSANHAWWQSHTVVDSSGGAHLAFNTGQSVYYAYCARDCGTSASWTVTAIAPAGSYGSLVYPSLALDSAGHPRMLRYIGEDNGLKYAYSECNANCTQAASWKSVKIQTDPYNLSNYPRDARYFAMDGQGRPRFVTLYYAGFDYVYCDSACTTASNWHYADIDLGGGISVMQLALNASGQPRVIGVDNDNYLVYAECSQNCAQSASWRTVQLADGVGNLFDIPTYSLRLDAQGRPRIAFFKADQGDSNLYYAWSDTGFINAGNWFTDTLPQLPSATDRTVELLIDRQGTPYIIYASDKFDLRYLKCTANCNTLNSEWIVQDIETGDGLDVTNPIPPGPGAWGSSWWIDGYASAALDDLGRLSVSYFARNVAYVNTSTVNQAWAIRFATASGAGPAKNRLYLPFARR